MSVKRSLLLKERLAYKLVDRFPSIQQIFFSSNTGNDVHSGDRFSGNDRFSGPIGEFDLKLAILGQIDLRVLMPMIDAELSKSEKGKVERIFRALTGVDWPSLYKFPPKKACLGFSGIFTFALM